MFHFNASDEISQKQFKRRAAPYVWSRQISKHFVNYKKLGKFPVLGKLTHMQACTTATAHLDMCTYNCTYGGLHNWTPESAGQRHTFLPEHVYNWTLRSPHLYWNTCTTIDMHYCTHALVHTWRYTPKVEPEHIHVYHTLSPQEETVDQEVPCFQDTMCQVSVTWQL